MKASTMAGMVLIVLLLSIASDGMTTLYYGRKYISYDEAFHGTSSLLISAKIGSSGSRTMTLTEPAPLDGLDPLEFMICPYAGDGRIEVRIYLEPGAGGGEETEIYGSLSWDDMGWGMGEWEKFDATTIEYKKKKDDTETYKTLQKWMDELGGSIVVKVQISLFARGKVPAFCYIDLLRIAGEVATFDPLETKDIKDDEENKVEQGESIKYTITYGNSLMDEVTNVRIVEHYDPRTVFVEAYPAPDPGTNNVWTIPHLAPGEHGQIVIKVKTQTPKTKAEMTGSVSGSGFASVRRSMSTGLDEYNVINRVEIACDRFEMSGETSTLVKPFLGTDVAFHEHGSGQYWAEDKMIFNPSRIRMWRDMNATKAPTSVDLWGRTLAFNDSWSAGHLCEGRKEAVLFSERFSHAESLNLSAYADTSNSRSTSSRSSRLTLESNASFVGIGDYEARQGPSITTSRMVGNFTVENTDRVRDYMRKKYPSKQWLECCFEEAEDGMEKLIQDS
ncbi:MAG: hypothetical protein JW986_05845 [Methanotrichaceae archaeon]|nr:hypothetical protein [Methanotrichaceae archaeon]